MLPHGLIFHLIKPLSLFPFSLPPESSRTLMGSMQKSPFSTISLKENVIFLPFLGNVRVSEKCRRTLERGGRINCLW